MPPLCIHTATVAIVHPSVLAIPPGAGVVGTPPNIPVPGVTAYLLVDDGPPVVTGVYRYSVLLV